MIMNIIILTVLLFLVYLNKDRIITLFKKDDVNKPFDNKSYDLKTRVDSYTDEIGEYFFSANFNVTVTNLSRKDEVIRNIKFYANRVKKDNYAFNDDHELIIINDKGVEKTEVRVPQSRSAVQKFNNDFKMYVNEELTFSFNLPCKSMALLLSNMNVNKLTLDNWLYFISVELEMMDGTISYSNKIPLSGIIRNIERIANFDLESISRLMEVVDQNDVKEQAKRIKYRNSGTEINLNDTNLDEYLNILNNNALPDMTTPDVTENSEDDE